MKKTATKWGIPVCAPLALALALGAAAPAFAEDAGRAHWAEGTAAALADAGVILNGEFPEAGFDEAITRGRFVTAFMRALPDPADPGLGGARFTDVPEGGALHAAAAKAKAGGYVQGYEDGSFRPDGRISRQEMFTIIGRAMEAGTTTAAIQASAASGRFADAWLVAPYAARHVELLARRGVVRGYGDGTIRPLADVTCAEALAAIARVGGAAPEAAPVEESAPAEATSASGISFEGRLAAQAPADENYILSPFSVKAAMAMAANGAEPGARAEILGALGIDDLGAYNQWIQGFLGESAEAFRAVNSIWLNRDNSGPVGFSDAFKGLVSSFYRGRAADVTNADGADLINAWISGQTNGKIDGVVDDDLVKDCTAFLVNAAYFKNQWREPFDAAYTKPGAFTERGGGEAVADFMHGSGFHPYLDDGDVSAVKLFFEGGGHSMIFALPKDGTRVADPARVAERLDAVDEYSFLSISMPRFKVEFDTSMLDAFEAMGVRLAFDPYGSWFPDMYEVPPAKSWIVEILHKAYVSVDESGAEAAAATVVAGGAGSASDPGPPIPFDLDRPFLYMICDEAQGEILFMGEYAFVD